MNQKKFYINLYILIPLIYSGISIIGVILTCQLIGQSVKSNPITTFSFFNLIMLIGLLTFFVSLLIIRIILKPLVQFVQKTQKLPIFKNYLLEKPEKIIEDVKEIEKVFDNVVDRKSVV